MAIPKNGLTEIIFQNPVTMVIDETFRGVPEIYKPSRQLANRLARRDAETRSGVSKTSGRESQQARPEAWNKKKAESSYAFRRPLGFRQLKRFRFFCPLRRQFCVCQSLAHDLRTQQTETVSVIQGVVLRRPIVITENLLVNVAR